MTFLWCWLIRHIHKLVPLGLLVLESLRLPRPVSVYRGLHLGLHGVVRSRAHIRIVCLLNRGEVVLLSGSFKLETARLLRVLHVLVEPRLESGHRHGFVFGRRHSVRWDTRNGFRSVQRQLGRRVLTKYLLAVHLHLRLTDVFQSGSFGHVVRLVRVVKGA